MVKTWDEECKWAGYLLYVPLRSASFVDVSLMRWRLPHIEAACAIRDSSAQKSVGDEGTDIALPHTSAGNSWYCAAIFPCRVPAVKIIHM
jgi:hypothetical protein